MESKWLWNAVEQGLDGWGYYPGQGWFKYQYLARLNTPVIRNGYTYGWLLSRKLTGISVGTYWQGWSPVTHLWSAPGFFAGLGRYPYGIGVEPPR